MAFMVILQPINVLLVILIAQHVLEVLKANVLLVNQDSLFMDFYVKISVQLVSIKIALLIDVTNVIQNVLLVLLIQQIVNLVPLDLYFKLISV